MRWPFASFFPLGPALAAIVAFCFPCPPEEVERQSVPEAAGELAFPVITGRVVRAADGTPVPGAEIDLMTSVVVESFASADLPRAWRTIYGRNRPVTTVTSDDRGAFRIQRAAPGDYTVRVRAPGFGRRFSNAFRIPERGVAEDLILRLKPGYRYEGLVRNRDGDSVSEVRVQLFRRDRSAFAAMRTCQGMTGHEGRFVFEDLEPGEYLGVLLAPGYGATWMERFQVPARKKPQPPTTFTLGPSGEVFGRVVDISTGKGLEGALVYALVQCEAGGCPVYFETRSAKNGAYALKGISTNGSLTVSARLEGFCLKIDVPGPSRIFPGLLISAAGRGGGRDRVDLSMMGHCTIAGRVLVAESLRPIPGAEVTVYSPGILGAMGKSAPVPTDEKGEFEVRNLPAGRFAVVVTHPDFEAGVLGLAKLPVRGFRIRDPHELDVRHTLAPGEVRDDLQVVMKPALRLRGRVVDREGTPVPDAHVEFEGEEMGFPILGSLFKTATDAVTDEQGWFELVSVPMSKGLLLRTREPRRPWSASEKLDLKVGRAPEELNLVVESGAIGRK